MVAVVAGGTAARRLASVIAEAGRSAWSRPGLACSSGSRFRKKHTITSVVVSGVYPDVSASAACVRTDSIVRGLAKLQAKKKEGNAKVDADGWGSNNDASNRVLYATPVDPKGRKNPFERDRGSGAIEMIHLPPNRSDRMENYFGVKGSNTQDDVDLVVFDRFFVEEAHSFRFREVFPTAALVLDMQDMHSLRWGRQAIVEAWDKEQAQSQQENPKQQDHDPLGCLPLVLDYLPTVAETTKDDRLTRELASIHRSDLVLVCSPSELHWLKSVYKVPEEKLCLASFFVAEEAYNDKLLPKSPSRNEAVSPRFVFCGGFKHAPNADAVKLLIDVVWPKLQSDLPEATLHIYGAFCPDHLLRQNKHHKRIHVHGYEPDLATIFGQDGGILLAPLRFGAGIKGKIIDAWTFGMPVVTTPIGSEGMVMIDHEENCGNKGKDEGERRFGGSVASTLEGFCESAIYLAQNQEAYRLAQSRGRFLLKELFSSSRNWEHVRNKLSEVLDKDSLARKRQNDFTQAMLWHQSLRSTEYFSRWVELKEGIVRDRQKQGDAASPHRDGGTPVS